MKKHFIITCTLLSGIVFSQVGINTPTPSATLDITAKSTTGSSSSVEGILIPGVDREKALSMINIPTSTLIYINDISTGTQSGTAVNIDNIGYYYFENNVWQKLSLPSSNIGKVSFFAQSGLKQSLSPAVKNIVTFLPTEFALNDHEFIQEGPNFKVKNKGIYKFSASVTLRPNSVGGATGQFSTNLFIEKSTDGVSWTSIGGSRTTWTAAGDISTTLKLPSVIAQLNQNDNIRLIVQRPFGGDWVSAEITTATGLPYSKSFEAMKF